MLNGLDPASGRVLRVASRAEDGELQRLRYQEQVGPPVYAATFVRLRGGDFRVVLTPGQFFDLWKAAA